MIKWRYNSLELCWYTNNALQKKGLVWCNDPIYCASSVTLTEGSITINDTGLHGLSDDERASLLKFLQTERWF